LFALLAAASACQSASCGGTSDQRRIALAAGPPETAAGCLARSFTAHFNEQASEYRASVLRTDGAIDSLVALRDGRADLAVASADTLAQAVNGEGPFESQTVSARAIATLYTDRLYLMVPDASAIGGFSDLRDRTVGVGPPGSGMEVTFARALEAARLQDRVTAQPHQWSELRAALDDGRVSAVAWLDGLPSPAIAGAVRRPGRKLRFLNSASVVPLLQHQYGELLYQIAEVPAAAYGTSGSTAVVGVSAVLVARHDVDEPTAFAITSALFRLSSAVATDCPALSALTPKSGARPQPAALHGGAALFYRQAGRGNSR
jgi:uncharacterized protein